MKKIITTALFFLLSSILFLPTAFAQGTILPAGAEEFSDELCMEIIEEVHNKTKTDRAAALGNDNCMGLSSDPCGEEILSCGIKTGNIHLWMIPFYIARIAEFGIAVVGLISVLFVMLGGYFYAWGGITEDKEKGKKTIMYALIGMALATLSWIIVNIIQTQLTT